ncbi:MAG: SemiSWEET family transporter [Candidatus Thermoplasmatota archaeon]|nr:SemiSWEET family transporter [Candidatus Thermoplasmatota archaeon]
MDEMVNTIIELAGLIGILIISSSGITQLYKALKTHSVEDLSILFFLLLLIGIILLTIYTVSIRNIIFIIGNIISMILTTAIIPCILKWK